MSTGLESYDALKRETTNLPKNTEFTVSQIDEKDLCKLNVSDLVSRGFDDTVADEVVSDLNQGCLDKLGEAMGLSLEVSSQAPKLSER